MRTYSRLDFAPTYIDLNIGEAATISKGSQALPSVELLDIGYQGPAAKPSRAELSWITIAVEDSRADLPLGWWRTVQGVRVGADLACRIGVATVRGAIGGEVMFVGGYKEADETGSPGIAVSLLGDDGLGYMYVHMSELKEAIEEGARIERRGPIGLSGNAGFESINAIPDLHFEMVLGGTREAIVSALRPPFFEAAAKGLAPRINPLRYLYQWFEEYLEVEDSQ